jgi:thiamine-phosphate pyrophosphorylase
MTLVAAPWVYLVTDRRRLSPEARTPADETLALEAHIDAAVEAGVDAVQIRERDLDVRTLCELTARVVARTAGRARILVNDRTDVVLAAGADGVHLRRDSPLTHDVRPLGPAGWIVGRSVHTPEEAGGELDADYVLFGSVFPPGSKPDGAQVAGLSRLQEAVAARHGPVFAIGGITPARARQARAAGAAGVAGIGVFLPPGLAAGALGAAAAVRALRAAIEG